MNCAALQTRAARCFRGRHEGILLKCWRSAEYQLSYVDQNAGRESPHKVLVRRRAVCFVGRCQSPAALCKIVRAHRASTVFSFAVIG
eukprot:COSAG03_NODE_21340_length_305_cov_1.252427_1_plen_86_part_10